MAANHWRRYPAIWLKLFRYAFVRELEFKSNFVGRIFIEMVWIFTQVVFFGVVNAQVGHLGNLRGDEIWLFTGSIFFVDGLFMMFLHDNQKDFGSMVGGGLLDYHLTRPLSALFLACFRNVNTISLFNILVATSIVVWSGVRLHLDALAWVTWFACILLGFGLILCLTIATCAISFWTTRSANLVWLMFELYRLGWRPESLYAPWMRRLLIVVFPAAFFISIPVQLSLGRLGPEWIAYTLLAVTIAGGLTATLWVRGLRRYEGAMS